MSRKRKVIGLVGHNYLREPGLVQLQKEFDVAMFAKPSSALHRIAKYSCPIRDIDLSDSQFLVAVRRATKRGIEFSGFLSIRDWNVVAAAKAAATLPRPPISSSIADLSRLRSKSKVRELLNRALKQDIHTKVDYKHFRQSISDAEFKATLRKFLKQGPAILKPDRGSCSYHITRVASARDIDGALVRFRKAREFRGGDFIVERLVEAEHVNGFETQETMYLKDRGR